MFYFYVIFFYFEWGLIKVLKCLCCSIDSLYTKLGELGVFFINKEWK